MQYKLYNLQKANCESNRDLAKIIGKSVKQFGKKKNDEVPFNLDEMFKISNHYGLPLDDIFIPRVRQKGYKIIRNK